VVLVSDKSTVFKGSIRSNLEISGVRDEKTLQDICKLVRLQGLDRKVDERGSNLSGGEKQRLILARALLFDAKVYLLDEITSNIDVESEKIIMEVVSNMKNKLVVMVSHRLENVVDADQIIVLDEGSLVGKGLHINLMNVCAPYRSLYTTQKQLENFMVGEHDA
ncbi:MAG: ATP-binding cassette domain-containing protein, partial [Erysipelothrix sp.]|nr:ATP-binding cassette domain-containing protein [Erysipelothrix sp.]